MTSIVQNLHLMGETVAKLEHANALARSASFGYKTVGGVDLSSGRSNINLVVSVEELKRVHFESCKMLQSQKDEAEDRHVDWWSREGKDGR